MTNQILIVIALAVVCSLAAMAFVICRRTPAVLSNDQIVSPAPAPIELLEDGNFSVVDGSGTEFLKGMVIGTIPSWGQSLDLTSPLGQRAVQLTSEIFKGAVSLPNKSIELLFRPEIQAGLNDGTLTLMKTKIGETLADAVDQTGKIVAKGRVIEAGKLRQLAGGAYQLTSIVVAQSHLADIERSLKALKEGVEAILANLESGDKANIKGSIAYLLQLGEHIKQLEPKVELPAHMKHVLENLVLASHVWREKLHEDVACVITRIKAQGDSDSWGGTEYTHKALVTHASATKVLLVRHELLMQLQAMLHFVFAYIDPTGSQHTRPDAGSSAWHDKVASLSSMLEQQSDGLLSSAWFNSQEMLGYRRNEIKAMAGQFRQQAGAQQTTHDNQLAALATDIDKYFRNDGGVRIALSFDGAGAVTAASLV